MKNLKNRFFDFLADFQTKNPNFSFDREHCREKAREILRNPLQLIFLLLAPDPVEALLSECDLNLAPEARAALTEKLLSEEDANDDDDK